MTRGAGMTDWKIMSLQSAGRHRQVIGRLFDHDVDDARVDGFTL